VIPRHLIPTPLGHPDDRRVAIVAARARRGRVANWLVVLRWTASLVRARVRGPIEGGEVGRRVRALAEHFGGLWIKVGQLLSLRIDLFGLAFCRELGRLQDSGTGLPTSVVTAVIERELGVELDRVFEWFDPAPMAAASIGQVHRARLPGGRAVAVKIQRPGIADRIGRQLGRLDRVAAVASRTGLLPQLAWRQFAWELREVMREELDYRYEAANTQRMRRRLRRHGILVPRVYTACSTARVLVTELVEGVAMVEYIAAVAADPERARAWLDANRIDPSRVARHLAASLLRQILEDNLFHGDLHPGNILLLRDNRVALIDFGTVSSTDREYLEKFRAMMHAITVGDVARVADFILLMCAALPPLETRPIVEDLVRALEAWTKRTHVRDLPFQEKSLNNAYSEVTRVLLRHRCVLEWAFLRIRRAQETLDASVFVLDPQGNPTELAARYFESARRRSLKTATAARTARRVAAAAAAASTTNGRFDVAEWAIFELELIRRRAIVFEAQSGRVASLAATLVGALAVAGAAVAIAAAVAWLAPKSGPQFGVAGADVQVRVLLLAAAAAFTLSAWRLRGRLERASTRLADAGAGG
jgi:ubiquinone biosynthesis protein